MRDYDPLIYNHIENAASNLAENIWSCAPFFVHHVFIPMMIYSAYFSISMAKGLFNKIAHFAYRKVNPSLVPTTADSSELMMNPIRGVTWAALREGAIFLGIQKLSSLTNHQAYWDAWKPTGIAFLRGLSEKLIPSLASIFDKGDINFSAREFVPDGGFFSSVGKGLRTVVRFIGNKREMTLGEKVAPEAYDLGRGFADVFIDKFNFMKSLVVGPYQTLNCLDHKLLRGRLGGDAGSCAKMQKEYQVVKPMIDTVSESAWQMANDSLNMVADGIREHPYLGASAVAVGGAVGMYFGWSAIQGAVSLVKLKTWDYFYRPKILSPVVNVTNLVNSATNTDHPTDGNSYKPQS